MILSTILIMNDEEIISAVLGEGNFEAEEDEDSDVDFLIKLTCPQLGIVSCSFVL